MKRPVSSSADEAIEATAAAWLAERESGLTPEDARDFAAWCAADSRHAAAVARLESLWGALQELRDFRPEARKHPDLELLRPRVTNRRYLPAFAAVAAAVVLTFATAWFVHSARPVTEPEQTFATTVDGYQRVSLADGSVVELNGNTEVKVQLARTERNVRLVRGEAHFTVAKDATRPFWVAADAVTVRAVGTAFDVQLGGDHVDVLVTEGKVRVASATAAAATHGANHNDSAKSETSGTSCDLVANQMATVTLSAAPSESPAIRQVDASDIRNRLAWQGPRLVFVDTPLAETIAQFNRRNRVQIVLGDPELASVPVAGSFRSENVDAFLRLIATPDNRIVIEQPDADHIVLRRMK
jgi:transmembrane sensor